MHVEPHDTPEHLARLVKAERRARVARRLLAVRRAMIGRPAPEVAREALVTERQVRNWVARYNAEGVDGLADRPKSGRPGPLDRGREARLRDRLRAGPTDADGVCALRGEDVRRILRDEFGVVRSLQATYDLLHRLASSRGGPGPVTRRRTRRRRPTPKKSPRPRSRGRGGPPRRAGRGLVRGRGAVRTEGDADLGPGRAGHSPDGAEADGLRRPPRPDGRLPGDRAGRGPDRPSGSTRRWSRCSSTACRRRSRRAPTP